MDPAHPAGPFDAGPRRARLLVERIGGELSRRLTRCSNIRFMPKHGLPILQCWKVRPAGRSLAMWFGDAELDRQGQTSRARRPVWKRLKGKKFVRNPRTCQRLLLLLAAEKTSSLAAEIPGVVVAKQNRPAKRRRSRRHPASLLRPVPKLQS